MEDEKIISEKEYNRNPLLDQEVKYGEEDNKLKNFVTSWAGEEHHPESGEVTVEMIIETLAKNFPEVVMVLAEENFIRGYSQALDDEKAFSEQG